MTILVPPPVTAAVALGPVSQLLPAQYRFVGDDWDDEAAFLFTFYTTLPTFDLNGNPLTQGTVRDLTGCTFAGTVAYRPRPSYTYPPQVTVPATAPQAMAGTVNITNGQASLTLDAPYTAYPRQSFDAWQPTVLGFESSALLEVRGRLTDSNGKTVTQGVIPLFVF